MLISICAGVLIGYERRLAGKAAGIRTMALVSLGACIFTLCSVYGFQGGNMQWDASRVAAAIPSGVGFLGAGVIWKGAGKEEKSEMTVRGLTTACSIWLAAAVGVAAGGGFPFVALGGSFLVLAIMNLKAPLWAKRKSKSLYKQQHRDHMV